LFSRGKPEHSSKLEIHTNEPHLFLQCACSWDSEFKPLSAWKVVGNQQILPVSTTAFPHRGHFTTLCLLLPIRNDADFSCKAFCNLVIKDYICKRLLLKQ